MKYKLMFCGFSALCENLDEIKWRLAQVPIERAQLESYPSYVIELDSGKRWDIVVSKECGYQLVESNVNLSAF